jgi:uncharacterized protein YecT (DUF1311 family)
MIMLIYSSAAFSQIEPKINQDVSKTYKEADKKLNEVYQRVLKTHKSSEPYKKNLRNAQRLWIEFRDAQFEMNFPESKGRYDRNKLTEAQAGYLTRLTEERTKTLRAILISISVGLVAYYPFNGNANDESDNGNNGKVFNAILAEDRFGNTNCAYNFDGEDSYIEIPNSPSLSPTNLLSLSAWIFPKQLNFYPAVLNKGNVGNYQESFALYLTPDNRLGFLLNWNGTDAGRGQIESECVVPLNTWTHVASTYDGVTMYIYINGVQVGHNTFRGGIFSLPAPLLIGKSDRQSSNYPISFFNGSIDNVEVFNRNLSPEEIQEIFNAGSEENK